MSLFRNHAKTKPQPKIRIERAVGRIKTKTSTTAPISSAPLLNRPRAIAHPTPRRSPISSSSPCSSPNPFEPMVARSPSVTTAIPVGISPVGLAAKNRISPPLTSSDEQQEPRKRKTTGSTSRSPDHIQFESSSESEDDDAWLEAIDPNKRNKRLRMAMENDPERVLLESASFEESAKQKGRNLVHAADLSCVKLSCTPAFKAKGDDLLVTVQYPSLYPREEFELVWGKDKINAVPDIIKTVEHVAHFYLDDEQVRPFVDDNGIIRQLTKASNDKVQDLDLFKSALIEYNKRLRALVKDGSIKASLQKKHGLPSDLVSFILSQVYDRTVAPKVELLSKYENGTDNVYGELLAPFVTSILVDKLHMKSSQVFVDLGSGVGNVVIQAALQVGCESWGCEMMENACNLGDAQLREFKARCKMWGLSTGRARLERGDFRQNTRILEALKRADVILVNNKAFTAQLNDDLVRMFLDLKKGCKIVSLKSFVPDHKSNHNANDVGSTILSVEQHTYPEDYVSWTSAGGHYFISTRK